MEQGTRSDKASAFAFQIHRSTTDSDASPTVVVTAASADPYLPNAYLSVDARGALHVIDSIRGAYNIGTSPPLPTQWMCRVSLDSNVFLVGDETRCVRVSLTDECDACIQTPISLTGITDPISVDFTWVVWGSRKRPFALKWVTDAPVMCTTRDAHKHLVSAGTQVRAEGNRVLLGDETIAKLPPGHSISCMYGNTTAVDVVTTRLDLWRVDVRANTASCAGLPVDTHITTLAPLIGWT
jgi:hypothetical protein